MRVTVPREPRHGHLAPTSTCARSTSRSANTNAELVVDRAALKFPADGQESSASAPGQLTIHGQTKPVTFTYKAARSGSAYQVSGAVHVNLKDHGIDVPSYAGVTVKPDVDVAIKMKVDD